MVLLSKNEPQAKAYIQEIVEVRGTVADLANGFKEALEPINPNPVTYERIAELLAMPNEENLIMELFHAWKRKQKINLSLSLIRTHDQDAWPEEIKKAYKAYSLLKNTSKNLKAYWSEKKKAFQPVELTKAEEKAIYEYYVEHVANESKKQQYGFMELQAELFNEHNAAPARRDGSNQITPAKINELYPHYAPLLTHKMVRLNKFSRGLGTFQYEVNKEKFVKRGPKPTIFI